MAAEAHIRIGNESQALNYINQVRNRVGMPDLQSSGAHSRTIYGRNAEPSSPGRAITSLTSCGADGLQMRSPVSCPASTNSFPSHRSRLIWPGAIGHRTQDINTKYTHHEPQTPHRHRTQLAADRIGLLQQDDDKPTIGTPPSEQDAQFTYSPSASNPNIIDFTASNQSLAASWDFGNGSTGQGGQASAVYPFAGTYTVTLTVQNSGGSRSSSQDIVIQQDDPSLVSSPLYDMLTGGPAGVGFKVWAVDSAAAVHMGVGPNPVQSAGYYPEWWASEPMEKLGGGMYDDRYVFHLQGFQYDMITNGDVYVNSDHAGIAPMTDTIRMAVINDFKATFPDQLNETWTLTEGSTRQSPSAGSPLQATGPVLRPIGWSHWTPTSSSCATWTRSIPT